MMQQAVNFVLVARCNSAHHPRQTLHPIDSEDLVHILALQERPRGWIERIHDTMLTSLSPKTGFSDQNWMDGMKVTRMAPGLPVSLSQPGS